MHAKTVILSSDARGLEPNATVVSSLLAHTGGPVWVRMFSRDVEPVSLESGRLRLEVVRTPEELRLDGRTPSHVSSGATFDRFAAIPHCVDWDRAVVLDYDQVVTGDPSALFEMDLGGHLAAGRMWGRTLAAACTEWFGRELPPGWEDCGGYRFFYMGPVMNLKALREADAWRRFLDFHAAAGMEEQIAFHVACSDRVLPCDARLNVVPAWDGVPEDARILHFTGAAKPWNVRAMPGAPFWRRRETTWEELTCGLWKPRGNPAAEDAAAARVGHVLGALRGSGRELRALEIGGWDFPRAHGIFRGLCAAGPTRWTKLFRPHVDPQALAEAVDRFSAGVEGRGGRLEILDGDPVEALAAGLSSGAWWEGLDAVVLHAPRDPAAFLAEASLAWRALREGGALILIPVPPRPGRVAWRLHARARGAFVDSLRDSLAAVFHRREMILVKAGPPPRGSGASAAEENGAGENGAGWTVVVTTWGARGTPHLERLRAANPAARVITALDGRAGPKQTLWRNCDRFLRDWWRGNRDRVATGRVLFIEHDVGINGRIPDWDGAGVAGGDVKLPREDPGWHWWGESRALEESGLCPVGLAPLGVLFASREAMDRLAEPEWDALYARDLFCELRLPSAVAACGLPVERVALPWVTDSPGRFSPGLPGVHHPVKS